MKFPLVRKMLIPAVTSRVRRRTETIVEPGGATKGQVPLPAPPAGPKRRRATSSRAEVRPAELEAGAADVRRRLMRSGASPQFADSVVRRVLLSEAKGAYAIDAAASIIGRAVPVMRSPKRTGAPRIIVFVGPTGAGKTATLAKLGRRIVEGGRGALFASLDPVGASALETVGGVDADVDRTEIPLVAIRHTTDLRRIVRRYSRVDAILLDTPGFSPREDQELDHLARELDRIADRQELDVYLVLPANASRSSLDLSIRAFSRLAPTAAVITKLDETDEPAVAIEEMLRIELPLAFLCNGQDVRGHVVRPTPDRLADLLLRGRMA